MRSWFDLLWDSFPDDGASATVGVSTPSHRTEVEELMYAWLRERQENVEQELYLDRSVLLIKRILADGEVTAQSRRRASHLFLAIRTAKRGDHEGKV